MKSPEEALETFYRGQKQRKTAETQLNIESSRSHSIFTLRMVAVPMDALGEDILSSPHHLIVSQLALGRREQAIPGRGCRRQARSTRA